MGWVNFVFFVFLLEVRWVLRILRKGGGGGGGSRLGWVRGDRLGLEYLWGVF